MDLVLERKEQADESPVEGVPGLMVTPRVGADDYWLYRVKLSPRQAVVGFPKFGVIGIGFAVEEVDWNTNLPAAVPAERLLAHILKNKRVVGDVEISDDDVLAAIKLIQGAALEDGLVSLASIERFAAEDLS